MGRKAIQICHHFSACRARIGQNWGKLGSVLQTENLIWLLAEVKLTFYARADSPWISGTEPGSSVDAGVL